ncbi:MAG: sulfur carrier protein ThiS [Methanobacteriota archaeon]|nr:MAG: sulfur carrier protein ThiS [Euryarchaeota archaeon]
MQVIINNRKLKFDDEKLTLSQLLDKQNLLHKKGIAVAVNGDVIPSSKWSSFVLKDNDDILIVTATQGG